MQRRNFLAGLTGLAMAAAVAPAAFAQTAPLNPPVTLTVGYPKVAHLAPMILIADKLKAQGVDLKLVEFARYADARTALQAGSLDIAAVGPADLPITLAAGSSSLVGIMGIGSSPKYVIGRNGVKLDSWDDIKGKKIAIAPGSAVWFQLRRDADGEGHSLQTPSRPSTSRVAAPISTRRLRRVKWTPSSPGNPSNPSRS